MRQSFSEILAVDVDISMEGTCVVGASFEPFAQMGSDHRADPVVPVEPGHVITATPEHERCPQVGDTFLDFQLEDELGKGSYGRVFLARQGQLAGRRVVLKIADDLRGEPLTLAQLQHTNIMPIYAVYRRKSFAAICMPYLGSVTLRDVLKEIRNAKSIPESGAVFVSVLQSFTREHGSHGTLENEPDGTLESSTKTSQRGTTTLELEPRTSAIREQLKGYSHVHAVLWLGARLADGLAHAHDRGILHRDLKPANILITDEGQPMLLDFNLAEDLKKRTASSLTRIGGTVPYMSPEQLGAMFDKKLALDARSDIYSLGIILFELLTGHHPFPIPGTTTGTNRDRIEEMARLRAQPLLSVRALNPSVSPAVESIIHRCLTHDRDQRYRHAAELKEDIERHLTNQPLRYARERSIRERFRKWQNRRPRLTSATSVAVLAVAIFVGLGTALSIRQIQLERVAAREQFLDFSSQVPMAEIAFFDFRPDSDRIDEGLDRSRALLARYQVLERPDDWHQAPEVTRLSLDDQRQLRDQIGSLLVLMAQAEARPAADPDATRTDVRSAVEQALRLNDLARRAYSIQTVPHSVQDQRRSFEERLTGTVSKPESVPDQDVSTHQRMLTAARFALNGDMGHAGEIAEQLVEDDPGFYQAWFLLGNCRLVTGRYTDAETAFTLCLALKVNDPAVYFNRGYARIKLRKYRAAHHDFDQAVALSPQHGSGFYNRGLTKRQLGDRQGAIDDLTRAMKFGVPRVRTLMMRATIYDELGEKDAAERDRQAAQLLTPETAMGWLARAMDRSKTDPNQALNEIEQGLQLEPQSMAVLMSKARLLSNRLDRHDEAITVMDRLIRLYPQSAKARATRGLLHGQLGHRDQAIADARASLRLDDSPANRYRVASVYALTAKSVPEDRETSMRLLRSAIRDGYGWNYLRSDRNLKSLHDDAAFRELLKFVALMSAV